MLKFIQTLINSNIRISTSEIIDLYKVLSINDNYNKEDFHDALQTTLIKNYEDIETFDHIYEMYFKLYEDIPKFDFDNLMAQFESSFDFNNNNSLKNEANRISEQMDYNKASQQGLDKAIDEYLQKENYQTAANLSNNQEQLSTLKQYIKENLVNEYIKENPEKLTEVIGNIYPDTSYIEDKDFSAFTIDEIPLALNVLKKLSKQLNDIYTRQKIKANKGKINIKKTIKNTLNNNPKINYRKPKKDKNDLILLLDISGSMKDYIKYILALIINTTMVFDNLKIYVFMSKVMEIKLNDIYREDINDFMDNLLNLINNIYQKSTLGFGTDYANTFFMLQNRKIYSKKTYLLIIGDGINTKEELGLDYLMTIKNKVKQIYMLNPLKQEEWNDEYSKILKTFECNNFNQLNKIIRKLI